MFESIIQKHLLQFKPYVSARSQQIQGDVFLDANELALGSAISCKNLPLNRYPDPFHTALREKLTAYIGTTFDTIFVGVGSDEVIDLLVRLVCEPGKDEILILDPTYGVYKVCADLHGIRTIHVPLNDPFDIAVDQTIDAITENTKILFCCSPNNPTGNALNSTSIKQLCQHFSGLVVVDEAYQEFSMEPSHTTALSEYPNLVVTRTLSKAWGLAGIRLGYAVAHPEIISYLYRIKPPYNVNAVTLYLGEQALENEEFMNQAVSQVRQERTLIQNELEALKQKPDSQVVHVYPSDANFLLVQFNDAQRVYNALLEHGMIVRKRSEDRLKNCLRFTIGTPEQNKRMLACIANVK